MEFWENTALRIEEFLDLTVFRLGNTPITIWTLFYLLVFFVLILVLTARLKNWIVLRLLEGSSIDVGVRQAVGTIVRYIVVALAVMVLLQTSGVDLSALAVLAGALGIGLAFGLQNITTNFVSGLIILFERPIKIGDRIEMESITGDVIRISARATTILTNDNIAVIVPNSDFVSSKVINWSYTNRDVRFNFPVGVSYKSDPEKVRAALMEVAAGHPGVLQDPAPDVMFDSFGDSSMNFTLRVWTRAYTTKPRVLQSELYYEVCRKFREQGIEIPFPQRDLHLKSGWEQLTGSTAS